VNTSCRHLGRRESFNLSELHPRRHYLRTLRCPCTTHTCILVLRLPLSTLLHIMLPHLSRHHLLQNIIHPAMRHLCRILQDTTVAWLWPCVRLWHLPVLWFQSPLFSTLATLPTISRNHQVPI
jgi:hypothetical protein